MNVSLSPLIDPRGAQSRRRIHLAARPGIEELKKGPILFYDNTKLGFCNYGEVFTRIKERLRGLGAGNFLDYRETVRGKDSVRLREYAAMLAKEKPVCVLTALGDMGTSPATAIITIALEELGIPTLYMTAPPGHNIARATAFYRAGHLCLCPLYDLYQGSSVEEVRAMVDGQWERIWTALCGTAEEVALVADLQYALDTPPPAGDCRLHLALASSEPQDSLPEAGLGVEEATDLFDALHISDGLPIVPPTERRVEAMFEYCPFPRDMVLAEEVGPSGRDICVMDVAVAAVMAGCKPRHMPILVTAFKALAHPAYNFLQSVTTSHPGGNMILVSGPLAKEAGIHSGQGCLGPGFPANACIGRAVNLVIIAATRSVPGYADLACFSSQAEFTYCFAESGDGPWKTINQERFDAETTSVYVLKAEPPHDVIDFLSLTGGDLLDTFLDSCTTLGSNNAYIPGPLLLLLTPDHAQLMHRDGYTKERIRNAVHANVHHAVPMVRGRGLMPVRPKDFSDKHPMPVTRGPADVEVVVAGGRGGHSAVILPWALHSEGIVEAVRLPDGRKAKSLEDFKRRA
ncbi:MAG: hypothetical protein FWG04_01530 [Desulfovibrionaceae bacterium]|nr:hypothetical protein [Desulfovibrionaceae bacterium]